MPPLLRRAAPIFGLSALGVLALAPTLGGILRFQLEHSTRPVPPWVRSLPMGALVALSLIQPMVLAGGASVLGAWLAPKLGLRSHLAERSGRFLAELPLALVLGAASGAALFALDLAVWKPMVGDALATMVKGAPRASLALTVSGLFYGGCTEEVLMRWGLMSALAAGLQRLSPRPRQLGDVDVDRGGGGVVRPRTPTGDPGSGAPHRSVGDPGDRPQRAGGRRVRLAVLEAQPRVRDGGARRRGHLHRDRLLTRSVSHLTI